jgi:RecA-family ATPase
LPLGKVAQLIAEGGAGKTMLLCQLAVSVATGARFLRAFDVPKPGRVLLVLGEEDAEESRRRLYRAANANRETAPPTPGSIVVLPLAGVVCPMVELGADGNLVEAPFARWLRQYVDSNDFRLIVVDPLSRFAGPTAETDNAAATRFIQSLESLVKPSTTVLNAHHVNKVSRGKDGHLDATSGRGSSAFVDGARWQCALGVEHLEHASSEERARLGEVVTLAVTKSNYAVKPDPVVLRYDHDNGGALVPLSDEDLATVEAARTSAALRTPRGAARQADGASKALAADTAVLRAVTEEEGMSWRRLATRVAALADCGDYSARKAIERMASHLEARPGKRGALMYYPRGSLAQ